MLSLEQVRRLKEVLRATSAPLAFESFSDFAGAVLNPLIDLMRSHGGNLYITDVSASQKPIFLWHTYDSGFVTEYRRDFYKESPIRLLLPKQVRVGQSCEYVDYEQFQRTSFYGEFLAPRRLHHLAALVTRVPEGGVPDKALGVLGLQRKKGDEAFSAEELEILDLLYNPVEGALHTLLLAGGERAHLERAFAGMPVGVLVLDWKLQPVYRNPALAAELGERELTDEEWASLRALAGRAREGYLSRTEEEPGPAQQPVRIERRGRRLELRATVLPEGLLSARPHVLCIFEDRRPRLARPDEGSLRRELGLTEREAEIVSRCLLGGTNADIAAELGISAETVKHHLKNVFQKTGVRRRSQLAALLSARSEV